MHYLCYSRKENFDNRQVKNFGLNYRNINLRFISNEDKTNLQEPMQNLEKGGVAQQKYWNIISIYNFGKLFFLYTRFREASL